MVGGETEGEGPQRRTPERDLGLLRLLVTNSVDPGCEMVCATVDLYVELTLAGGRTERTFPGLAAHFRACPACWADYLGLLDAVHAPDVGLRGPSP